MKKHASLHIMGIVQGVGFRPFIYGLALRLGLKGWVRNTSSGVDIEIEGNEIDIDAFLKLLYEETPPLAQMDTVDVQFRKLNGFNTFKIVQSESIKGEFQPISPDISICSDCLEELFDPEDRRYRYPFINCTNCGPRFTIIKDIPYDRPLTTMAPFEMCYQCAEEYEDPLDRRFHAQPVACPQCGPRVWLESKSSNLDKSKTELEILFYEDDAIGETQSLLSEGKIVAIKGLGGFHLACDATNIEAVRELRKRKLRVDKPFALMFSDLDTVLKHCFVDENEARLLESRERPIVILKRRPDSTIALDVAPSQSTLGVMLPYTPFHYLLFSNPDLKNKNAGSELTQTYIPNALVMTSGNLSEEPIAIKNDEALDRLSDLCDVFLMHDRDIRTRCDDSVVRVFSPRISTNIEDGKFIYPIRRSRGYAPFPLRLPGEAPPILAVGGELKNTFCITRKNYAFVSHHIGDMENYETLRSFEDGVAHFQNLYRVSPEIIAYDLHPNYLSTRYALERSGLDGIPAIGIQHHHAHIAACMAENRMDEDQKVIGIVFDGTGYGEDGSIWGGEIFLAGYKYYQRIAHLEYLPLPGGDSAIRNPARIALAYLWKHKIDWDLSLDPYKALCEEERTVLRNQLENGINVVNTSSIGRLFDAVSAIIGVRQKINYEAQAAIELEMLAEPEDNSIYPINLVLPDSQLPYSIDTYRIINSIYNDKLRNTPAPIISARFHNTIAKLVYEVSVAMRNKYGELPIVLSGGVWQNMYLLNKTMRLIDDPDQRIYIHRQVPANDGGIALGQAVISMYNVI